MSTSNRRRFLADVGSGMLTGALGASLAMDLGIAPVQAAENTSRVTFGEMEPLVALMQETPLRQLQGVLVEKIRSGTELRSLIQAGTLANARAFGGQDYIGYHTFMALAPSLDMAERLPTELKPLPVLKVLYRNTERIHASGHSKRDALQPIASAENLSNPDGIALRAATRKGDLKKAEQILAGMSQMPRGEMYNHVQYAVQDAADVHRVVLAWRAWLAVDLVGEEYAQTLLRQSVRFCSDASKRRIDRKRPEPTSWKTLPALVDQYGLLGKPLGTRRGNDEWVEDLAFTIFTAKPDQACDAVAQAMSEGFGLDSICEAISVSANMQLLHDAGRSKPANGDKIVGSVHGDSPGVHASDAANAWRNIARVSNHRNAVMSLLLGAYNTAGATRRMKHEPWPLKHDQVEGLSSKTEVLATIDDAVRAKDQALAGAAVERFRELGGDAQSVFDLMLGYATSEDGALHAEKFYRTVTEEFATTRASLRWRQLVGLARVSASEFGNRAPGHEEACDLLKVKFG